MIKDPIIIAAPARSGTTMIAGLLIKHGVWVGKCKITRFPETNSLIGTENIGAKRLMKYLAQDIGYKNRQLPLPFLKESDVKPVSQVLDSFYRMRVPEKTSWLVKTTWTLIFSKVWQRAYPNAKWIFIDRDVKDIISSMARHPLMRNRQKKQMFAFIKALKERQLELMKSLKDTNYIQIDVDLIASKNKAEITRLFDFCEITMNEEIINDFIEPEKWHSNKK